MGFGTIDHELCLLASSAVVKVIQREGETDALREFLTGVKGWASVALASGAIPRIEMFRAVLRSDSGLAPRAGELLEEIHLIWLTDQVIFQTSHPLPPTLRTIDAIHLATAVSEAQGMTACVTDDNQLADGARLAGLSAVSPRA